MKAINRLLHESSSSDPNLRKTLIDFFTANKNPQDIKMHELAGQLNVQPDFLETEIFSILVDFFAAGKYNESPNVDIDPEQLRKGIEVEQEHTTCPLIAARIAKDHLAEIPDYYTRLESMEQSAGIQESVKINDINKVIQEVLKKVRGGYVIAKHSGPNKGKRLPQTKTPVTKKKAKSILSAIYFSKHGKGK